MLEFPFEIKRVPCKHEMFALELLSAACSDELHGTNYFVPLLVQSVLKRSALP